MKKSGLKNFLPLIIIFSMCFSTMVIATADNQEINKKVRTLLEAVNVYDSKVDTEAFVTRSDFVNMILKITNYNDIPGCTAEIYDVAEGSSTYEKFSILANLNIITPVDGKVRPNDNITGIEAVKITVDVLGYSQGAADAGGWQTGYISIAADKKLINGMVIDYDKEISYDSAYTLIYNALHTDISDLKYHDYRSHSSGSQLYMQQVLGIYKISGIVTDDGISTLTGKSAVPKGAICIDEAVYENRTALSDALGLYIEGYIKYGSDSTDKNYRPDLIGAFVSDNHNVITVINGEDILNFDGSSYTYSKDSRRNYEEKLAQGFNVIYNGKAVRAEDYSRDIMMPVSGIVTLIDNGEGNKTVKIRSYITNVVEYIDNDEYVIYDKLGKNTISYKDAEIKVIDENRDIADFDIIAQGDVISVAQSFDKSNIIIMLSRNKAVGTVTGISEDAKYEISDVEYKLTKEFSESTNNLPLLGSVGTAYLTFDGKIAYFDKDNSKIEGYAYFIKLGTEDGIDESLYVKMFTEYGRINIFKVSSKCKVDGIKVSAVGSESFEEAFYNAVVTEGSFRQLVKYKLNNDMEIVSVDTVKPGIDGDNNTFSVFERAKNESFTFKDNSYFGGKVALNADTKIFLIPTDEENGMYNIGDASMFKSGRDYKITAFKEFSTAAYASAITYKTSYTSGRPVDSPESLPAIITSITKVLDSDGFLAYKVKVNEFGTDSYFLIDASDLPRAKNPSSVSESIYLEKGDIIRYGVEADGKTAPDTIQVIYDKSEDTFFDSTSVNSTNYNASVRVVHIIPVDIDDGILVGVGASLPNDEINYENYNLVNAKIMIYDSDTQKIRSGTKNEIITYEIDRKGTKPIFVLTSSSVVKGVIMYK